MLLFSSVFFLACLAVPAQILPDTQLALTGGSRAGPQPSLPDPRTNPKTPPPDPFDAENLSAFSKASAEWGNGVEAVIEDAYRKCFRTYIIAGKVITLHLPFAENNERAALADAELEVSGGGKGDPLALWNEIDALLASPDFQAYVDALTDGREKVVVFDIPERKWSMSREWFSIDMMKAGAYPGLPHKPYFLTKANEVTVPDIYNYLYCVGRVGVDCSGFVWYVLRSVARTAGIDLERAVGVRSKNPRATRPNIYVGTWFFDPRNKNLEEVKDEVRNLRPADVILFRGEEGVTSHSAVIQSIDMANGTIRYVQSTDMASLEQRGVHESFITFDPSRPEASLKDPSVVWHQRRSAPFPGEVDVVYWDDGSRYRAYPEFGGGTIVRFKALKKLFGKQFPVRAK